MANFFSKLRLHWSPANQFSHSLLSNSTCKIFFSTGPLRMHSLYLILRSKSILDVIYGFSDTPTVISHITLIMAGPSWLNVSAKRNFLLKIFCLDGVRIESRMTNISDYYHSSVLSPSSITYKQISRSSPRVLSPGRGLPLGLAIEALTVFRLKVLSIFDFFKHKSIFNRTSISNVTMTHLRK